MSDRSYSAFITYRHVEPDQTWARWLHRALERYRIPADLARDRALPRRLGRVFLDEEELPACADLSSAIATALDNSDALIVVCSPRTPDSRWVEAEIARFLELGRGARIFAILIEGEPKDSFPKSLQVTGGKAQLGDAVPIEPLAADVRESRGISLRQRRRSARLRLVAGLLGCSFDDLRQRDQERRTRLAVGASVGLAILALVLIGATAVAVRQTRKAKIQQGIAEVQTIEARTQRGLAQAGEARARRRLAAVYEERARQYMLDNDFGRAVALLAGARNEDSERKTVDFMLGRAIAPLRAQSVTLEGQLQALHHAVFDQSGLRVATSADNGHLTVWDVSSGAALASFRNETSYYAASGLQFLPGGKRLLVSEGGVMRVWDIESRTPTWIVRHCFGKIHMFDLHTDGEMLVTAGEMKLIADDATVKVWRIGQNEPEWSIVHGEKCHVARFSPDGRLLLTASSDKTARLWSLAERRQLRIWRHDSAVTSALFSADGNSVITAAESGGVNWWSTDSDEARLVKQTKKEVQDLVLAPDGERLLGLTAGKVVIMDAQNGSLLARVQDSSYSSRASFSPDGRHVLVEDSEYVRLYRSTDLRLVAELDGHANAVLGASFNPTGTHVVTVGADRRGILWEWALAALAPPLGAHRFAILDARFLHNEAHVATAAIDALKVWDARSGDLLQTILHPSLAGTENVGAPRLVAAMSRNGRSALTAGPDRRAIVWDVESGSMLNQLDGHAARVVSVSMSPSGKLAATGTLDRNAFLWDSSTGEQMLSMDGFGEPARSLLFTPSEDALIVATGTLVRVLEVPSGRIRFEYVPTGRLRELVLDPAGRFLATADDSNVLTLHHINSGEVAVAIGPHAQRVELASFSRGGDILATVGGGPLTFWNLPEGSRRCQWETKIGIEADVVAIAPGGELAAVAVRRDVYLVRTDTGSELAKLRAHSDSVRCLEFSDDGLSLLTASDDGTARVWVLSEALPGEAALGAIVDRCGWILREGVLHPAQSSAPPVQTESRDAEVPISFDNERKQSPSELASTASAWLQQGDAARAVETAEQALEADPELDSARLVRAVALGMLDRAPEALLEFDHVLGRSVADPLRQVALRAKSLLLVKLDRLGDAILVARLDPRYAASDGDHLSAANRAGLDGRDLHALGHLEECREAEGASVDFALIEARALARLRLYQKALDVCEHGIRKHSTSAELYYVRAQLRSELEDTLGAISDYTEAIRFDPNHARAYNNRGNLRQNQGDGDLALDDFDRSIALEPELMPPRLNRAQSLMTSINSAAPESKQELTSRAIHDLELFLQHTASGTTGYSKASDLLAAFVRIHASLKSSSALEEANE